MYFRGGSSLAWGPFLLHQLTGAWYLLTQLLWPAWLSVDPDIVGLSRGWTVGAMTATVIATVVIIKTWARAPLVAWALLWTALALLPRFVFRTVDFLHEPHLYVAMPAVSLLLGHVGYQLWQWRPSWRWALPMRTT